MVFMAHKKSSHPHSKPVRLFLRTECRTNYMKNLSKTFFLMIESFSNPYFYSLVLFWTNQWIKMFRSLRQTRISFDFSLIWHSNVFNIMFNLLTSLCKKLNPNPFLSTASCTILPAIFLCPLTTAWWIRS